MEEKLFTEKIVENLKKEVNELNISLERCRKTDNFSMYKHLINGYGDVIRLIQDLDWKLMYSKYGKKLDNGTFINAISTWEQNGDGQVKNIKEFGRLDFDEMIYLKGDKIEFNDLIWQCICVDNEYAVFSEIKDDSLNMQNTIILGNENKINHVNYKRVN